ncbi:DUF676-domain-containing protein, partial [Piedraia hortae CBS 480.64]
MLLVHQAGSVKVGEVVRYTLTYTPANDRILPTPKCLHLRIKNTCVIPLRAAWLHGPYVLHVASYPASFNPHEKVEDADRHGVPEYEPMLKAGGIWETKLRVPDDIRQSGADLGKRKNSDLQPGTAGSLGSMTWIVEVTSQILFSSSASVNFELMVGRDERSLNLGFAAVAGHGHGAPGQMRSHSGDQTTKKYSNVQTAGVYSKAIRLVAEDTPALWDKPALPTWDKNGPKKRKKVHLVIITHGLHSNVGADMLFLKESIDATVKKAREERRKGKKQAAETSIAPLSGGQEDLEDDDDDEETTIVRGFSGNALRTENGIQYLGKRLAKYVLKLTYPDQPFLPVKKGLSRTITETFGNKPKCDGHPAHRGSSLIEKHEPDDLPYKFTGISFVGHSLGGLVQTYAIAYIHKHSPTFFHQIEPRSFICMASPMLGLSNENPLYVKFALDFGLVGRTGQDLGLSWRPNTLARGGWNAMMGGLAQKDGEKKADPTTKPLLRVLPTGPAHQVLQLFRNRTVYSNVVNDGIVPLRTSCLLFLDWRGLGKVEKARRENGLIGTVAEWGWAELTGLNASSAVSSERDIVDEHVQKGEGDVVPLPAGDEIAADNPKEVPEETKDRGMFDHFLDFFRPNPPVGKTSKAFHRGQTVKQGEDELPQDVESGMEGTTENPMMRPKPRATRGDSIVSESGELRTPPKTSIFESAGDILHPPLPGKQWITDPSSRSQTIFHDRIYHPEDIPPAPIKRHASILSRRTSSSDHTSKTSSSTNSTESTGAQGSMKVEEKIARAYHNGLSWRKVLVRLEPDAHNNIIVRRMFANAYGWPVIKHLCDTHFADTYAANTRDDEE